MSSLQRPKWAREIERFLPIKPQFLLCGNVHDVFPAEISHCIVTLNLTDYLCEMLKNKGYALIVLYEPLIGFTLLHGEQSFFNQLTGENITENTPFPASLERAAEIAAAMTESGNGHTALLLRFASRMKDLCEKDTDPFFYRLFRLSLNATPKIIRSDVSSDEVILPLFNPIFWIMDKENDLPPWYVLDNPRVRVLPVPRPDNAIRSCLVEAVSPKIAGFHDLDERSRQTNLNLFKDQTTGLLAGEIAAIAQMAHRERLSFGQIGDAIRRYKLGIQENMWEKLDGEKIATAESFLNSRVMGQTTAIRHAADILKRSRFNLSGAQFSRYSQRPKGILFLAGPTGVGKTELAKAITELVFASPTHYIRFDMSEFGHEHADQRLIGSPPGYVGYDVGGELTNAIKQNPFSIVLFDEVEKAHPKILDVFLQILDDGRLTSGRGETVYFSESIIVFTSNLGMFEKLPDGTKKQCITPDMPYSEIKERIDGAIEDFFKFQINRPEILNRIGKNIAVFDFIREETAEKIMEKMMGNLLFRLKDSHNIRLKFTGDAYRQLTGLVCSDLSMGGRGIGSNLESFFMNPLSRKLCELIINTNPDAKKESTFVLFGLYKNEEGWELDLRPESQDA